MDKIDVHLWKLSQNYNWGIPLFGERSIPNFQQDKLSFIATNNGKSETSEYIQMSVLSHGVAVCPPKITNWVVLSILMPIVRKLSILCTPLTQIYKNVVFDSL